MDELPKGGSETILVAEDDETLRKLAITVLSEFGYTVILAEDGDDAVEKFKANRDAIRLVILDMLMPKKNGMEAYDVIRSLSPDIKVLFASGYAQDMIRKEDMIDAQFDFVMKPLSPIDLLKKVRDILDR
ncbi:MAG: response regulator [Nitrospirae bacterium]|nr:response regulator [Nitrospirota bacterium]